MKSTPDGKRIFQRISGNKGIISAKNGSDYHIEGDCVTTGVIVSFPALEVIE